MDVTFLPVDINKILKFIIIELKKIANPSCIILSGSFGKFSWLYYSNYCLSDLEITFISEKIWSFRKKKSLLKHLKKKFNIEVHIKGYLENQIRKKIFSNYANRYKGYISLNFYDTFFSPTIVYKVKENLDWLPCISISEVPIWEAWRLFTNRIAEILDNELSNINKEENLASYNYLKAFESAFDSYLIIRRKYDPKLEKRIALLNQLNFEQIEKKEIIRSKSFKIIKRALISRQFHKLENFKIEELTEKERKITLLYWLEYIQNEMLISEGIIPELNGSKSLQYIRDKKINNKYLETTLRNNILPSNILRLVKNPSLIMHGLIFKIFLTSWRHLILMTINTIFTELVLEVTELPKTRILMEYLLGNKTINNLTSDDLLKRIILYWKLLK